MSSSKFKDINGLFFFPSKLVQLSLLITIKLIRLHFTICAKAWRHQQQQQQQNPTQFDDDIKLFSMVTSRGVNKKVSVREREREKFKLIKEKVSQFDIWMEEGEGEGEESRRLQTNSTL
jgi:hypothetical protein